MRELSLDVYKGGGYPEENHFLSRAWVELSCQSPDQRWDWANVEVRRVIGKSAGSHFLSRCLEQSKNQMWDSGDGQRTACLKRQRQGLCTHQLLK